MWRCPGPVWLTPARGPGPYAHAVILGFSAVIVRYRRWVLLAAVAVVAVLRHYAAHPADRPMIGTPAEHRRLVELLATPPGPVAPPPSRRRTAALAAAGVLAFGVAVTVDTWLDDVLGRHSVIGYAWILPRQLFLVLSLHFFAGAARGVRASRRPATASSAPQPAPPEPEQHVPASPAAGRPSWARDVTNHY